MIYIQDHFLEASTCQNLIKNPSIIGSSKVVLESGQKVEDYSFRNSIKFGLQEETAHEIHQKILDSRSKIEDKISVAKLITTLSPIKVLRYEKGHFFKRHRDIGQSGITAKRILTAIIFLKDSRKEIMPFKSGKLILYGVHPQLPKVGFPIEAKARRLIVFPSNLPH